MMILIGLPLAVLHPPMGSWGDVVFAVAAFSGAIVRYLDRDPGLPQEAGERRAALGAAVFLLAASAFYLLGRILVRAVVNWRS